jgi:hypothetical protein
MPKPIKQKKRPTDPNQVAHHLVGLSTQEQNELTMPTRSQISMVMAELGRRGGKIGGKRRLKTMTAEERQKVATKAANARWKKVKKSS